MRLPLRPPVTLTMEDQLFVEIGKVMSKLKAWESIRNAWILEATWRLIDMRFCVCRCPTCIQLLLCRLGRQIQSVLKAYL